MFLHSDELRVRPAFLCVYGHVVVAFLDEDSLHKAIDAFNDGGPIHDMTPELDRELSEDTTLSSGNLGAFLGPPLRAVADAHRLRTVVLYLRRDDVSGAMAIKFEHGRLFGAADEGSAFGVAMSLPASAGDGGSEGLAAVDLTELVYQRLGREMPEPLPDGDDYFASFPADPGAMTGGTITVSQGDVREIDITAGAEWALLEQRKLFSAKFGREPGPDDPVFFNPDAEAPEPLTPVQQQEFERMWEAHPELERMRADAEARLEEHGHVRRAAPKPRRNNPCPCGSGKKFKHCHGR